MNLLLTSDGLTHEDIKKCFMEEINNLDTIKIAVLYTMKNPGDEKWLKYREDELNEFNIKYDFINISEDKNFSIDLLNYGVIYVCGGNTYYILDRLRKTGIKNFIKKSTKKNILYVGLSAGSMVMAPDIEISGIGPNGDQNDINLQDMTGFKLIPFSIHPHYEDADKIFIEKFFNQTKKPVVTLNNNQAIFFKNGKFQLLGKPGILEFGININKI